MAEIFIGIGSNVDREVHVPNAIRELAQHFSRLTVSPVYRSASIGFDGDDFYNLVIKANTELDPERIYALLRTIEARHGRVRVGKNQFVSRTLDLDLLLYDDLVLVNDHLQLPHDDIVTYPFVLKPLADIAAGKMHPVLQKSFALLWQEMDKNDLDLVQAHLEELKLLTQDAGISMYSDAGIN